MAADGEAWEGEIEEARRVEGKGIGVQVPRAEEVRERWEGAAGGLEALRGVTEGVARLERAERVLREVEGS